MRAFKIIALLMAFAVFVCGCGVSKTDKETSGKTTENSKKVSVKLEDVKNDILKTINPSEYMNINADAAGLLYGIELKDMKQCQGFTVMEGTFPHEVVMIEAANDEAAKRIEEALNIKLNSFAQQSKNYDAENYELAKKCKLEKNGKYFGMLLSPDYEEIIIIYNKYIK